MVDATLSKRPIINPMSAFGATRTSQFETAMSASDGLGIRRTACCGTELREATSLHLEAGSCNRLQVREMPSCVWSAASCRGAGFSDSILIAQCAAELHPIQVQMLLDTTRVLD